MMKIEEREQEYTSYIDNHISNVKKVWDLIQPYLKDSFWLDDYAWHSVRMLIEAHDESKHNAEEFNGYRQFFYPMDGEKNKTVFDYAWNTHQKFNPHHWQYWIMWKPEGSIALDMPFNYIFEMLCDWSGMSLKFGDKPSAFYAKEKDKMLLSESTRGCVERWIEIFDEAIS